MEEQLLSLREAAKLSGIAQDYLRVLINRKSIHGVMMGRDWFVSKDEILSYLSRPKKRGRKSSHILQSIDQHSKKLFSLRPRIAQLETGFAKSERINLASLLNPHSNPAFVFASENKLTWKTIARYSPAVAASSLLIIFAGFQLVSSNFNNHQLAGLFESVRPYISDFFSTDSGNLEIGEPIEFRNTPAPEPVVAAPTSTSKVAEPQIIREVVTQVTEVVERKEVFVPADVSRLEGNVANTIEGRIAPLRTQLASLSSDLFTVRGNLDTTSRVAGSSITMVTQSQRIDELNSIDIDDGATIRSGNLTVSAGSITASGGITADTLTLTSTFTTSGTGTSTIAGGLTVDSSTLVIDSGGNKVGISTSSPFTALSVVGNIYSSGSITASLAPTSVHTFSSWATDAAGSNVTAASFVVNPASASTDANLIGVAVNGGVKFLVDAEGDVFAKSLTTEGSNSLSSTTASNLLVENNTYLGDAIGDSVFFNVGTLTYANRSTSTVPAAINAWSIATSTSATPIFSIDSGTEWGVGIGIANPGNIGLRGGNLDIRGRDGGGIILGTNDGVTAAEEAYLYTSSDTLIIQTQASVGTPIIFNLGGGAEEARFGADGKFGVGSSSPGALLSVSAATTVPAFLLNQTSTGDLFTLQDSGSTAFVVRDGGNIGVATSSPVGQLSIEMGTAGFPFWIGDTGTSTPALTVTGAGRIGIGTSSPLEKLTLTGGSFFQAGGDGVNNYTPTLVGEADFGGMMGAAYGHHPLVVSGRYAYGVGSQAGAIAGECSPSAKTGCEFKVFDISTSTPSLVGGVEIGAAAYAVAVAGDYAYLVRDTTDAADFTIYDVSNPTAIATTSAVGVSQGLNAIYVSGKYAYAGSNSTGILFIYDVSDPRTPILKGSRTVCDENTIRGIQVVGKYAYVICIDNDGNEFNVVDVSNPSNPVVVGGKDLGDVGNVTYTVHVSYPYAFVGKAEGYVAGDFIIYDVSNPSSIATTSAIDLAGGVYSIYVSGRYAYVGLTNPSPEFRIIDIGNIRNPVTVGSVGLSLGVNGVYVQGRRAYLSVAGGNELRVYDLTGIETQSLLAHSFEAGQAEIRDSLRVGNGVFSSSLNVGAGGVLSYGPLSVFAASTTAASNTPVALFNGGYVGIGTTTPFSTLQIASSTKTFFTITDTTAGANLKHWTMSSQGGNFYIATSSDAYATSSVSALTINSNGAVNAGTALSVGTTTPGGLLSVSGGTAYPAFLLNQTSTGDLFTLQDSGSTAFIVKDGGSLGIGTSTPGTYNAITGRVTIDAQGSDSSTPGLLITDPGSVDVAISLVNTETNGRHYQIFSSGGGTNQGAGNFSIYDRTATVNRFSIDSNGYIGIGSTSPATNLSVNGNGYVTGSLGLGGTPSEVLHIVNANARIRFDDTTNGVAGYIGDADSIFTLGTEDYLGLRGESGIQFGVADSLKMKIDSQGNVGIGTTSIGAQLHLSRTTAADSDLRFESQTYNWIMGIDNSDGGKFKISSSTALGTSDRLTINGAGFVGIGSTSPSGRLSMTGPTGGGYGAFFEKTMHNIAGEHALVKIRSSDPDGNAPTGQLLSVYGDMQSDDDATASDAVFIVDTTGAIKMGTSTDKANVPIGLTIGGEWPTSRVGLFGGQSGQYSVHTVFEPEISADPTGSGAGMILAPIINESTSGSYTHPLLANLVLYAPTVVAGADTVTNTATLYVKDAMSATVTGGNYSIFVDDGTSRFDSTVGIGTSTPGALLSVSAGATTPAFLLNQTSTGDLLTLQDSGTTRFIVKDGGNVGIGTSSPGSLLQLEYSSNASTGGLYLYNTNNGSSAYTGIRLGNDTYGPTSNSAGLYRLSSANANYAGANSIMLFNDISAPVALATNNTVRLTVEAGGDVIVDTGNLGVGTTSPGAQLHLSRTTAADADLRFESQTYNWIMGIDNSDGGKFKISSSTALGTSDRLTIDGSGNVGIGTNAPTNQLHVAKTGGTSGRILALDYTGPNSGNTLINITSGANTVGLLDYSLGAVSKFSVGVHGSITNRDAVSFNGTDVSMSNTNDSNYIVRVQGNLHTGGWSSYGLRVEPTGVNQVYGQPQYAIAGILSLGTGNGAIYTIYGSNAATSTAGNYGVYGEATGSNTGTNYGGYFTASGATNNYGLIVAAGRAGIGTTSPGALLSVSGGTTYPAFLLNQTSTGDLLTLQDSGSTLFRVTDGAVASVLNSTGLGIGTTTPGGRLSVSVGATTPALLVNQTSTGDLLTLQDSGTTIFTVKDGGTVGYGSTTPWGKLSVEMDTTNPSFVVSNTGSSSPAFIVGGVNQDGNIGIGTTPNATSRLTIAADDGNTTSTTTLLRLIHTTPNTPTANMASAILFQNEDSIGTTENVAQIAAVMTNVSHGSEAGALSFSTAAGDSTPLTERMRLWGNGKISIGTTSAIASLDADIPIDSNFQYGARFISSTGASTPGGENYGVYISRGGAGAATNYGLFVKSSGATSGNIAGQFIAEHSTTNDISDVMQFTYNTSGTATDGIGAGILLQAEDTIGTTEPTGRISGILTTATHGNEASAITFQTRVSAGALSEKMRLTGTGLLGIGSTSPHAQLAVQTVSATTRGLVVKGSASQSANLFEWYNNSGDILGRITSGGIIYTGSSTPGAVSLSASSSLVIGPIGSGGSASSQALTFAQGNSYWNLWGDELGGSPNSYRLNIGGKDSWGDGTLIRLTASGSGGSGIPPSLVSFGVGTTSPFATHSFGIGTSGNTFAIGSAGREPALLINSDSSDRVGIGMSPMAGMKLNVNGLTYIGTSTNAVTATTTVGLVVGQYGAAGDAQSQVLSINSGRTNWQMYATNPSGAYPAKFNLGTRGGGTGEAVHLTIAANWSGAGGSPHTLTGVGIGTTSPSSLLHISRDDASDSDLRFESQSFNWMVGIDNSDGGKFKIASSTALGTNDRLVIDGSGNTGLGGVTSSNPDSRLHVAGIIDGGAVLLDSSTNMSTAGQDLSLTFRTSAETEIAKLQAMTEANSRIGLAFHSYNSGLNERMRIDADGDVGIGTTTPIWGLHVVGANSLQTADSGNANSVNLAVMTNDAAAADIGGSIGLGGRYDATGLSNIYARISGRKEETGTGRGYLAFATTNGDSTGGLERMRVTSAGLVGIASTTPWKTLSITGTVGFSSTLTSGTTGNYLCINTTTYEVTSGTTCSASSQRFKENIIDLSYGLDTVLKLRPVTFNYRKEFNPDTSTRIGFVAEEVAELVPELVNYDKDGLPESVSYANVTALLVKAIYELDEKLNVLAAASSSSSSLATNAWSVDQTTGEVKVNFYGDIDLHDNSLLGVKEIVSQNGLWSINEQGRMRIKAVEVDELTVGSAVTPAGVTLFDQTTKTPYCVSVDQGSIKTTAGTCGTISATSFEVASGGSSIPTESETGTTALISSEAASSTPETATTTPAIDSSTDQIGTTTETAI